MVSVMQALNEQQRAKKQADNFRMPNPGILKKLVTEQKKINAMDDHREQPLESLITIGNKSVSQDAQSGAIMQVLATRIPGFRSRITEGVKNGHTYNVIHFPGRSNFTFEDRWTGLGGKQETSRQVFVIEAFQMQEQEEYDEWGNVMTEVDHELDHIISLAV